MNLDQGCQTYKLVSKIGSNKLHLEYLEFCPSFWSTLHQLHSTLVAPVEACWTPAVRPEFEQFHLNLNFHDERVCVSTLLAYSTREDPGYIRNPVTLGF